MNAVCPLCPRHCSIAPGEYGFCRARQNRQGEIVAANYGQVTALALDPLEKKPFARFYPGGYVLSAGSYGCNFRCPFCQNHSISMDSAAPAVYISPEELVAQGERCRKQGNIGLAFTYNEPLVGYEYVMDCAVLARQAGLRTVLVTNGGIEAAYWQKLLPWIDAVNIDLKAFRPEFYEKIGGDLTTVKQNIAGTCGRSHMEITTLVIPGENDGDDEIEALAAWLAALDPHIPLHLSRFFPRYQWANRQPTEVSRIYRLADVARAHLRYVYCGNC
ncbi:MAG: AmmeMemoRadiSam system radical SAM enzyme [Firmicutes bacterium]|nr:AmmeMemoRadiSam system radical SAM enzyme [Bacillota bacterium]